MPIYDYVCDEDKCDKKKTTTFLCKYDDLPKNPKCEHCGKTDLRRQYGSAMILSTFDANGRVGRRVSMGSGSVVNRSMSREQHMKTGKSDSVYTKGYKEHLAKKNGANT